MTTLKDREKAVDVLASACADAIWIVNDTRALVEHIAAALAEEREKVRAPFLRVASELDVFVANRGLPATGSYDDGLNRAQANAAYAIRNAAEETE